MATWFIHRSDLHKTEFIVRTLPLYDNPTCTGQGFHEGINATVQSRHHVISIGAIKKTMAFNDIYQIMGNMGKGASLWRYFETIETKNGSTTMVSGRPLMWLWVISQVSVS
jgi:hypothetical protein